MNRIISQSIAKQDSHPDHFEKGRLFEEYLINLFSKKSFYLKEWRKSERFLDGFFPFGHSNPDLELVFEGKKKYRFAVECKWRKEFVEGRITWAANYQICFYEDFQNRNGIPVFVAIGIGGEPSNPEKLFVTPLCNISRCTEVFESDLILYERKPTRKFFYDTIQLKLF